MMKIGITGGIGSGKSTICNIFRNLGVPIFTSDLVSREILNSNKEIKRQVKKQFGSDMYQADGTLDRERMAALVFNDPKALEQLTAIVHPRVKKRFEKFCAKNEKYPYVIKEAAILFESGHYHDLDKIIHVFSPKEERIKRVMERDGVHKEEVLKRMRFQYSDEERNALADFIILNENKMDLLPQVMELNEIFINET